MKFSLKVFTFLIYFFALNITACQQLTSEERNKLYTANQQVAASIITALEQYHTDNDKYPENLSLLVPQYLSEVPQPTTDTEFSYYINELRGGYLLGFRVEENSGCGYSPRFGWDCGFGD